VQVPRWTASAPQGEAGCGAGFVSPAHLPRAASAVAGAIGLAVLFGWLFDLRGLKSVVPGFPSMQPWAATGIVLGALSLGLARSPSRGARAAWALSSLAMLAVAGVPLIEQATNLDLGTDLLLFPEAVVRTRAHPLTPPGRISPIAALGLVAMALALLLAPRARGWLSAAFSFLATAGLATAGLSLLGYSLGIEPLRAMLLGHIPALHTALAIGVLAVGTLALRPEVGWVGSVAELGRTGWIAVGLLAGAALLMAYSAQATLRAGVEAHEAARATVRLEALISTVKDAETGQRGYLLTGDEGYLGPYKTAQARLPDALAAFASERFEGSSAGLARIRTLADAKMAELAETIALRRSGRTEEALEVMRTGRGRALMDEIRAAADALTGAATAAATAARAQELRAAAFACLGALGLVILAFWAVTATAQTRRAAAERATAAALALGAAEAEAREAEQRLRQMQMSLAHANRVATMGQLTASVAHEVRQPITATLANAQAALRWLRAEPPELEEVRGSLDRIVRDGNRAGDVIERIRSLLKKTPARSDSLDINEVILQVIALLQGEAVKSRVSLQTRLSEGLPPIEGDRVQLQQVVLNLIVNAIEAMGGGGQGSGELLVSSAKSDSGYVFVAVRDSGPGLDPASSWRLFEAFYTTKPGGLGMGLSICRSIVEAHGGRLWAEANAPQGAVFQFTLPHEQEGATPAGRARA